MPPFGARLVRVRARLVRGWRRPAARGVVAALVTVGVTVVALWWSAGRSGAPLESTDAVRVGVPADGSIPGYVSDSRRELSALSGPRPVYALVSLGAYVVPDALVGLLAGVDVAEVIVRVPLAGAQTEIVRLPTRRLPEDVYLGMDRVAARKESEAAEYRRLASAGDAALRSSYAEGGRVAAEEAGALRRRDACVYAAVIRGSPAALTALAGRPGVRAVDPAPELGDPSRAVFLPPLPEQSDIARPPAGS